MPLLKGEIARAVAGRLPPCGGNFLGKRTTAIASGNQSAIFAGPRHAKCITNRSTSRGVVGKVTDFAAADRVRFHISDLGQSR